MNGSSQPSPELPLPVASPEDQNTTIESASASVEKSTGAVESISQQGPTSPMPMVDPSQFASTAAPVASPAVADPITAQQATADDADVIEKEWVAKAKDIVEKTRNNPREQSTELNNFKATYIKRRFNKDLKQPKEA